MIPSGLVVGFHGCDLAVADDVVRRRSILLPSRNEYDWLGHGLYFWQNDPRRALEWARAQARRKGGTIKKPAVIGATIDLGHCFIAAQREHIQFLTYAHHRLVESCGQTGDPLPRNAGTAWTNRKLDCAVFEMMHRLNEMEGKQSFDTVLAWFAEGQSAYPGAAIRQQDHVQICVRNPQCIVGWFLPEEAG